MEQTDDQNFADILITASGDIPFCYAFLHIECLLKLSLNSASRNLPGVLTVTLPARNTEEPPGFVSL